MGESSDGDDSARAWRDPASVLGLAEQPARDGAALEVAFWKAICALERNRKSFQTNDSIELDDLGRRRTRKAVEARCVAFWVLDSPLRRRMDPFQRMIEWKTHNETPLSVLQNALTRQSVVDAEKTSPLYPFHRAMALFQSAQSLEEQIDLLALKDRNQVTAKTSDSSSAQLPKSGPYPVGKVNELRSSARTALDPSLAEWIASAPEPPRQRPGRTTEGQSGPSSNASQTRVKQDAAAIQLGHEQATRTIWSSHGHQSNESISYLNGCASSLSSPTSDSDYRSGFLTPLGLNKANQTSAPSQLSYREWKKFGTISSVAHPATTSESPRSLFENRIASLFGCNSDSRAGAAMAGAAFRALLPFITEQDRFHLEHVAESSRNPVDFLNFLARFGSFMAHDHSQSSTPNDFAAHLPGNWFAVANGSEPSESSKSKQIRRGQGTSDWVQAEPFMYSNAKNCDTPARSPRSRSKHTASTSPFPFENSVWKSPAESSLSTKNGRWGEHRTVEGGLAPADSSWERAEPPDGGPREYRNIEAGLAPADSSWERAEPSDGGLKASKPPMYYWGGSAPS